MKKILSAATAALLTSPLTASACDGSIRCAMRNAPRQMLHMLPGFLSTHAGLLIGVVISAAVIAVVIRREAEVVKKD
jgi:hypothetical protein